LPGSVGAVEIEQNLGVGAIDHPSGRFYVFMRKPAYGDGGGQWTRGDGSLRVKRLKRVPRRTERQRQGGTGRCGVAAERSVRIGTDGGEMRETTE
jgi:hypothetical protein